MNIFFLKGVLPTPKNENGVEPKNVTDSPKGLGNWREAVMKCETAAQLAMCTYMLETAVAWDRSIMKAVSVNNLLVFIFINQNCFYLAYSLFAFSFANFVTVEISRRNFCYVMAVIEVTTLIASNHQ